MAALIKNNFPKWNENEPKDLLSKIINDPVVVITCAIIAFTVVKLLLWSLSAVTDLSSILYNVIGIGGTLLLGSFLSYTYMKLETSAYSITNMYED